MYHLTTELSQKLSDILQTGSAAPNHKVTVWRQNKENAFETMPFVLPEITRISIDRRWNMAADELQIEMANPNGYYSPDYSSAKTFTGVDTLPKSGYRDVLTAYNKIECDLGYGSSLLRMFTGQIQNVDIAENPPAVRIDALNVYRKLLKPVDPARVRELVYRDKTIGAIIDDLRTRAGIEKFSLDKTTEEELNYSVGEIRLPLGTTYADAVKDLLELINHRAYGSRTGELAISKIVDFSQRDFHNWEFDDYLNMSQGVYKYDSSLLRNRVVIKSDYGWQAFEDPFLVDYCNGEIISSAIDAPWARSLEEKWSVADSYFLTMRRKMRRISVVVAGNPAMDIGDLVKMRMLTSAANAKYMIIGIRSDYGSGGYTDQVDLEYVEGPSGHLCQPASGDYDIVGIGTDENAAEGLPVFLTLRDQITAYALSLRRYYYQWGGNAPETGYGLDSSHFIYRVLSEFGLLDEYTGAPELKDWAMPVTFEELLPGDLVFYYGGDGLVNHVALYIGNDEIISANGGDSSVNSVGMARSKNAKVKVARIDYRSYASYGRPPGLI